MSMMPHFFLVFLLLRFFYCWCVFFFKLFKSFLAFFFMSDEVFRLFSMFGLCWFGMGSSVFLGWDMVLSGFFMLCGWLYWFWYCYALGCCLRLCFSFLLLKAFEFYFSEVETGGWSSRGKQRTSACFFGCLRADMLLLERQAADRNHLSGRPLPAKRHQK